MFREALAQSLNRDLGRELHFGELPILGWIKRLLVVSNDKITLCPD